MIFRNMDQIRMSQGRTGKISASYVGTLTVVWKKCSYQVPDTVGINPSKNENIFKLTVQAISRGGGD